MGKIGSSSIAQAQIDKNKWFESIKVMFPTHMQWRIMLMLRKKTLQQVDIVDRLKVSNRADVLPVLNEMMAHGLLDRPENSRLSPYRLTWRAKKTYFDYDFGEIGTAQDVELVASRVADFYLKKEMFVAVAIQKVVKGKDRTDLIAFDYINDNPISIEIESVSEVQSHKEHVRYNMIKWRDMGFSTCHVWSKSKKVREIYNTLDEKEKEDVHVFII